LSIYIYPNSPSPGLENLVTGAPVPFYGIVGEEGKKDSVKQAKNAPIPSVSYLCPRLIFFGGGKNFLK